MPYGGVGFGGALGEDAAEVRNGLGCVEGQPVASYGCMDVYASEMRDGT